MIGSSKMLMLAFLAGMAVMGGVRAEVEEAARCGPCGIPRPGRRPCCPSSSDAPLPPPPEPCPCCPAPPSDFWCPCECPSSSSTICPPPPVPVPPCPVYCCDSSSSSCSSSSSSSCHWRRVPVPAPFLKPRCKPKPSSSSSDRCCCPCPKPTPQPPKPRHRSHRPRGCGCAAAKADIELEAALENPEAAVVFEDVLVQNDQDDEVMVLTHRDVALLEEAVSEVEAVGEEKKRVGPSCQPSCDKKKALQIVFQLDRQFVELVNAQDLSGLYKMVSENSRYAMISPNADAPGCSRVVGPLSQFLPNYIGYVMSSVFQDIVYNKDGSVTIHTLDVLTQGSNIIAQDVWRTYKARSGCHYKLDYLNGTNWLCKCPAN